MNVRDSAKDLPKDFPKHRKLILDIQYIIDNSDIGKFYKKKIDEKKKENNFKLKTT